MPDLTADLIAAAHESAPFDGSARNGAYTVAERLSMALQALDYYAPVVAAAEAASEAEPSHEATHLLTGALPQVDHCDGCEGDGDCHDGARLLVTVWPDGSGTAAYRFADDTRVGWGLPTVLEPAP